MPLTRRLWAFNYTVVNYYQFRFWILDHLLWRCAQTTSKRNLGQDQIFSYPFYYQFHDDNFMALRNSHFYGITHYGLIWRHYLKRRRRRRCVRTEAHRFMPTYPSFAKWDNSVFYVPVANATEFTFHGQSAWNAIVFYSDYYKPSGVTWIGPCLLVEQR